MKGLNGIKEAVFHSAMAGNLQISMMKFHQCFRFVDKNKQIREEFMEFIPVERINGKLLSKAIIGFYN